MPTHPYKRPPSSQEKHIASWMLPLLPTPKLCRCLSATDNDSCRNQQTEPASLLFHSRSWRESSRCFFDQGHAAASNHAQANDRHPAGLVRHDPAGHSYLCLDGELDGHKDHGPRVAGARVGRGLGGRFPVRPVDHVHTVPTKASTPSSSAAPLEPAIPSWPVFTCKSPTWPCVGRPSSSSSLSR
jgi:hypothetical protein